MYYFTLRKNLCSNLCEHSIRAIRETYKPTKISVLFIGESPPPDRQTFFYCERGNLYDATKDAFNAVFDMSGYDFLDFFRGINCYLYDLFDQPGIIVSGKPRKGQCVATSQQIINAVNNLNDFIAQEEPEAVVFVLKRVYEKVNEIERQITGKNLEDYFHELGVRKIKVLQFPTYDQRVKYIEELKTFLRDLVNQRVIKVPSYRLK